MTTPHTITIKISHHLPGEIATLICFNAEYICRTNGIRLMNHSPTRKMDAPTQEETNTPTEKMKRIDVTKPSPASPETSTGFQKHILL